MIDLVDGQHEAVVTRPAIVMLAPNHDPSDSRINRTLAVLAELAFPITVFYGDRFLEKVGCAVSQGRVVHPHAPDGVECRVVQEAGLFLGFVPSIKPYLTAAMQHTRENTIVYIHDSGLLGVLLACAIAKRKKNILFLDYHDYIPWAFYYQVGKYIKNDFVLKSVYKFMLFIFNKWFVRRLRLHGLVGISQSQMTALIQQIHPERRNVESFVIPNRRMNFCGYFEPGTEAMLSLVWIGNVRKGLDLEKLMDFISEYLRQDRLPRIQLLVIGRWFDHAARDLLVSRAFVQHLGAFASDEELVQRIHGRRAIGVFLGWDDQVGCGINEVASSNKMFTYLNLGLPVIYDARLHEIAQLIGPEAGIGVRCQEEFNAAVGTMDGRYAYFVAKARAANENLADEGRLRAAYGAFFQRNVRV